jgi:hypothetical protein
MLPGEKAKIFDEGLNSSDSVIVVLSKFSIENRRHARSCTRQRYAGYWIEEKIRLISVKTEPLQSPSVFGPLSGKRSQI